MTAPLIEKNPKLDVAQDFYEMRRRGIGFIEEMGSAHWTDYNIHDPGITVLEAASYAITDVAYRMGWDITDLLAPEIPSADPLRPYPDQPFFTAREILTVNPTTPGDFRRLLIDLPAIRDAWIACKQCACETSYFAWCEDDALNLDFAPPPDPVDAVREVFAKGLYEVLLEFDSDPELGDLNDRKVVHNFTHRDGPDAHSVILELRFPEVSLLAPEAWQAFLDADAGFSDPDNFAVTVLRMGATKDFDLFTEIDTVAGRDQYLRRHWRHTFYVSLGIESPPGTSLLEIENVTLRLFSNAEAKNGTTAAGLKARLADNSAAGIVSLYRKKAKATAAAVAAAKAALHAHRNLDEDYCTVKGIGVEEIAVCADVEVEPDADIEKVQAQIWFELSGYFNPPVPFRTLKELRDDGYAVEDIFSGPALDNGFVLDEDLEAAALRHELRVSDILNRLMDIEGVIAVNQLMLTKYDGEGNVIKGAADPQWVGGKPVFDPEKISAQWLLFVSPGHQPRLYFNESRFLFYKNGLPFMPRMDEARATLTEMTGAAERPKMPDAAKDLKIPAGTWRDPADYDPVQYSLPPAYGVGPAGLPSHVTRERKAQARNLKAYLMVFEQIIGNALAQLAHCADLFSLDPAVARTYFILELDEAAIAGFDEIAKDGLTGDAVAALAETEAEYLARRNRFLDHLLARFGESFRDNVLLAGGASGKQIAQQRLIADKIAFLRQYPAISRDRGKAFDYTLSPCGPGNHPGIKTRVNLLLGFPDLNFSWAIEPAGGGHTVHFTLADGNGAVWLDGTMDRGEGEERAAREAAYRSLLSMMVHPDSYDIVAAGPKQRMILLDGTATEIAQNPELFDTREQAVALRDELLAWASNHRLIVVEHLLLRPKFPGDALFPACCEEECGLCGDEDPYSFRLTFVMPGWNRPYAENLELRRFADRIIRQETPAHLLPRICWVGSDDLIDDPCDGIVEQLADLIQKEGKTGGGDLLDDAEACACAKAVYAAFKAVFSDWYADKMLTFMHRDALEAQIGAQFADAPDPGDIECDADLDAPLWQGIRQMMVEYFTNIAADGWQFERFEKAWCDWLDANAAIDWTRERLQDRVEAILAAKVSAPGADDASICKCARKILTAHGREFAEWLDGEIGDGVALEDLGDPPQQTVALCPELAFEDGTAEAVAGLLNQRYSAYRDVSYRLRIVVALLGGLRNIYPGATLHDCDDGSDHNPVRLDNTALGNYPHRTTLT